MYFEYHFPTGAPYWLDASMVIPFERTMDRIRRRMELLEEALDVYGGQGAVFAKYAKKLFDIDPEVFDQLPSEDIVRFVAMFDDGSNVEERMSWPNALTIVDTAFLTTKEWEIMRHIGIGGSDAAVILGVSPYESQYGLYQSKIGTPPKEDPSGNWVFKRGHVIEPYVIEAFCEMTGAHVVPETRMFASRSHPHCTANIDAIVRFDDGRLYVFEAKTTIKGNWAAWSENKIPRQYIPQARQYPAVLNDDRILGTYIGCCFTDDIVVGGVYAGSQFDGEQFVARFVAREPDAELAQLETEEAWFRNHVKNNDPPPLNGEPKTELQAMQRYIPQNLSPAAPQHWSLSEVEREVKAYQALKAELAVLNKRTKVLEKDVSGATLALIQKLGSHIEARVDLDDSRYLEIKNTPRARTKVDVSTLRTLIDVAAPHMPEELARKFKDCIILDEDASRVFSLKEKAKKP